MSARYHVAAEGADLNLPSLRTDDFAEAVAKYRYLVSSQAPATIRRVSLRDTLRKETVMLTDRRTGDQP
jgi:hypothetical protein